MTNILLSVVDDDESLRRAMIRLLESFGFRAEAFDSAEKFLQCPHLGDTSCLIADVQMPGMNGLELQSQLAASGYHIPIIFITAYGDKKTRRRAMSGGAVAFLGKPFGDEQLLHSIEAALDVGKSPAEKS